MRKPPFGDSALVFIFHVRCFFFFFLALVIMKSEATLDQPSGSLLSSHKVFHANPTSKDTWGVFFFFYRSSINRLFHGHVKGDA